MVGFPPAHCRVVASQSCGKDAYVLLDTGSTGQPYLYGVNCHKKGERWFESASGNGSGWEGASDDPALGTLSFWGDAPAGVDSVRIDFGGAIVDARVHLGAFLLVWWRVPSPTQWPCIVAIQEEGVWKPESDFGLQRRVAAERGDPGILR